MKSSSLSSLLSLLVGSSLLHGIGGQFIPGTSNTKNGYDKEGGEEAICWKSYAAAEESGIAFESPLIHGFAVDYRGIQMMSECPVGNTIRGTQPSEHTVYGERLRTYRLYDYPVQLSLNLTSLRAANGLVSDRGPGYVVLQVFNCVAGLSGFCSPFVHEQTIARQIAAAIAFAQANPDPNRGPPPPWRYIPGDLHAGSHAHSGWLFAELPPDSGPIYTDVSINIPQLIMNAGDYYTIVGLQLHVWEEQDEGEPVLIRYDIANKLEGRQSLTYYFDPPNILEVDPEILCVSYGLIGAAGLLLVYLLFHTVKNLKQQVMKLSQGSFLAFFLFSALLATVASFLFEPKNDAYCRASKPIVLISLQAFYAVTIGRLWRIHSLISPLLLKSLDTETPFQRLKRRLQESAVLRCFFRNVHNPRKIRTQVTEQQLAILVAVLVSPQIALQLLALIMQPSERKIDFNEDESTGKATCDSGDMAKAENLLYWGYAVFMMLIVGLLAMAYQSRNLPSLFDESQKIFDSTVTTFGILVLGVAVILVTDDPETSPSVNYLVWVFVVLSITTNTSYRIIYPKLQMIWRGETVIVSRLVLDHSRDVRKSAVSSVGASSIGATQSRPATGILYDETSIQNTSQVMKSSMVRKSSSMGQDSVGGGSAAGFTGLQGLERRTTEADEVSQSEERASAVEEASDEASVKEDDEKADEKADQKADAGADGTAEPPSSVLADAADNYTSNHLVVNKKKLILIEADQAPSRRLLLKMVDLQEHLHRVTQRIMSGMAVSEEDWEHARSLGRRFGSMMNDDVAFAWEAAIAEEGEEAEEDEGLIGAKTAI